MRVGGYDGDQGRSVGRAFRLCRHRVAATTTSVTSRTRYTGIIIYSRVLVLSVLSRIALAVWPAE